MDSFDDITYTPTSWTPGADADGKSNGEVKLMEHGLLKVLLQVM